VMKVNAAYVPLDPGFPTERIRFIVADADLTAIVSMSGFAERLGAFDVRQVFLDAANRDIDAKSPTCLADSEVAPPVDQACYIIYTSGTTGNPKGVIVEHPAICNFVRVAAELYGYVAGDRVHQGMSDRLRLLGRGDLGAVDRRRHLIPGEPGASLIGDELADFLPRSQSHLPVLLSHLAGDNRARVAPAQNSARGGEACPKIWWSAGIVRGGPS